ncbi:hypothetical protein [Psychrobacter sp. AOP31-A1-22]|uniref:hypothetical protein n=1 Tax=Psychrobacter sp. AOP31-A1-22 TaxID=3457696 RepID=UPI004035E5BB
MFTRLNDKSLTCFVFLAVAWQTSAIAAPLDALPNSPHPGATFPEISARADSLSIWFYNVLKAFAVVLGLWIVISSFLRIKAISNEEKQGSMFGAWMGVLIGGMLSTVATWLHVGAKTAEEFAGGVSN